MKSNDIAGDRDNKGHWESVHMCPKCSVVINLADLDLRSITTGVVECPSCGWQGPIDIRIVGINDPSGD